MNPVNLYNILLSDTDRDFDPSADMMVHDYDNEATIDEEEAMSGESCTNELDDLEKVCTFSVSFTICVKL